MKKLDKLVIKAFVGPFLVTVSVVVFIFLMRLLIFYIEKFVSKDIEFVQYVNLFYYCILNTIPIALPLAILLSSLMTFGNLGEFFELTAIKSSGISLIRVMQPLFVVVCLVSCVSFIFNDRISPWANLKFYSLLYNIKQTKATMNIKEGIFYTDLPGYSIKVDKKLPDGRTMKGMVIYKHDQSSYKGNSNVILADSGRMYTTEDKGSLVFELFNGNSYEEDASGGESGYGSQSSGSNQFVRTEFTQYKLVASLRSFQMSNTGEEGFAYHEFMKNVSELNHISDSIRVVYNDNKSKLVPTSKDYFSYNFKKIDEARAKEIKAGKWIDSLLKVPVKDSLKTVVLNQAKNSATTMVSFAESNKAILESKLTEANRYELEKYHKYTQAFSCLVLFLIGAPLGAIIKKGGFGMPVLISIIFYILMYFFTIQGDKWVKSGLLSVPIGAWSSNVVLLFTGIYFIYIAANDSRLFDKDNYIIFFTKAKGWLRGIRKAKQV